MKARSAIEESYESMATHGAAVSSWTLHFLRFAQT